MVDFFVEMCATFVLHWKHEQRYQLVITHIKLGYSSLDLQEMPNLWQAAR